MINDSIYNDDDGKKHQICQKLWRFVIIAVIIITGGQERRAEVKAILDMGTQATKETSSMK